MKPFVKLLFVSSALCLATGSAFAQSAPIRQGQTTTMKIAQETDARLAKQSARITELETQIQKLTGRMENLEYKLTQSERDKADADKLNTQLLERLSKLEGKVEGLAISLNSKSNSFDTVKVDDDDTLQPDVKVDDGPTDLRGDSIRKKTTIIDPDKSDGSGGFGSVPIDKLPNDSDELLNLGMMRVLNRDYTGAVSALSAYETSFEDGARVGEARYWLGEAYYNQGEYAESANYFTKVLKFHQDNEYYTDSYHKLARSLRQLGQKEKACSILSLLDGKDDIRSSTRTRINTEKKEAGCK